MSVLLVLLIVPWLVFIFLFCLMFALVRAHSGYLHLFRALLSRSSSSFSRWLLEQAVLVLCFKVLITLNFADRWCKYWSVCMGFLYTDVSREPSGCCITIVSRKGMDPSVLASSVVKWMCGSTLLICSRKTLFLCSICDHKMSSTYLLQILGGCLAVLMALFSKSSI